jgi:bifunctional DNA-binding transcriptional regulator/antitoxin component of YhaV-PrlF toxin-antitoxin module
LWYVVPYNIIFIYIVVQCTIMVKTTVQISKDTKWRIVIPEIVRTVEELQPGDFIEIDVKKIEKSKATA